MERVRLAMVGSKLAADLHLSNLSKLRGLKVDVLAIASKNNENAAAFAKRFSIPDYYDDYRRLLDRKEQGQIHVC